MAMLAILAACHKYFACGNKVLFCSVECPYQNSKRETIRAVVKTQYRHWTDRETDINGTRHLAIAETLTNLVTHLRKYNGVADPRKDTPPHVCYHV